MSYQNSIIGQTVAEELAFQKLCGILDSFIIQLSILAECSELQVQQHTVAKLKEDVLCLDQAKSYFLAIKRNYKELNNAFTTFLTLKASMLQWATKASLILSQGPLAPGFKTQAYFAAVHLRNVLHCIGKGSIAKIKARDYDMFIVVKNSVEEIAHTNNWLNDSPENEIAFFFRELSNPEQINLLHKIVKSINFHVCSEGIVSTWGTNAEGFIEIGFSGDYPKALDKLANLKIKIQSAARSYGLEEVPVRFLYSNVFLL